MTYQPKPGDKVTIRSWTTASLDRMPSAVCTARTAGPSSFRPPHDDPAGRVGRSGGAGRVRARRCRGLVRYLITEAPQPSWPAAACASAAISSPAPGATSAGRGRGGHRARQLAAPRRADRAGPGTAGVHYVSDGPRPGRAVRQVLADRPGVRVPGPGPRARGQLDAGHRGGSGPGARPEHSPAGCAGLAVVDRAQAAYAIAARYHGTGSSTWTC